MCMCVCLYVCSCMCMYVHMCVMYGMYACGEQRLTLGPWGSVCLGLQVEGRPHALVFGVTVGKPYHVHLYRVGTRTLVFVLLLQHISHLLSQALSSTGDISTPPTPTGD